MGSGSGGCVCYFGWGSSAGKLRWAAFVTLALLSIIFAICWQVEWKDCKVCWFTGKTLDTTESGVPVEEFLCRDVTNDDLIVHGKNKQWKTCAMGKVRGFFAGLVLSVFFASLVLLLCCIAKAPHPHPGTTAALGYNKDNRKLGAGVNEAAAPTAAVAKAPSGPPKPVTGQPDSGYKVWVNAIMNK